MSSTIKVSKQKEWQHLFQLMQRSAVNRQTQTIIPIAHVQ